MSGGKVREYNKQQQKYAQGERSKPIEMIDDDEGLFELIRSISGNSALRDGGSGESAASASNGMGE